MLTPNAFSMRSPISGESEDRSLRKLESAARVMPRATAAAVTESSIASMISVRTKLPGCGGFFNRKFAVAFMTIS